MLIKAILFLIFGMSVNTLYAQNSCVSFLQTSNDPAQIYLRKVFVNTELLNLSQISNVKLTLEELMAEIDKNPENLDALKAFWHLSRKIRANLELQDQQLKVVRRIVSLEGKNETNQYWLLLATMQNKQFKEAFDIASMLVIEHFGTVKYRILKVEALMGQNLLRDAAELAAEYSAIYPNEVAFQELAAKSYLQQAELTKMGFYFRSAEDLLVKLTLRQDPKPWYFFDLLEAKLGLGKYQEVIDYVEFSRASVLQGAGGRLYTYFGYVGLKDFYAAESILNELISAHPDSKRFINLKRSLKKAIKSLERGY